MAEEVRTWLEGLRLGEYTDALTKAGCTDISGLSALTDDSLRAAGVEKLGHRKRLLKMAAAQETGGGGGGGVGGGGAEGAAGAAGHAKTGSGALPTSSGTIEKSTPIVEKSTPAVAAAAATTTISGEGEGEGEGEGGGASTTPAQVQQSSRGSGKRNKNQNVYVNVGLIVPSSSSSSSSMGNPDTTGTTNTAAATTNANTAVGMVRPRLPSEDPPQRPIAAPRSPRARPRKTDDSSSRSVAATASTTTTDPVAPPRRRTKGSAGMPARSPLPVRAAPGVPEEEKKDQTEEEDPVAPPLPAKTSSSSSSLSSSLTSSRVVSNADTMPPTSPSSHGSGFAVGNLVEEEEEEEEEGDYVALPRLDGGPGGGADLPASLLAAAGVSVPSSTSSSSPSSSTSSSALESRAFSNLVTDGAAGANAAKQLMQQAAKAADAGPRRVKMTKSDVSQRSKAGWLEKKSTGIMAKTHPWDRRYCVWESNHFFMYLKQSDHKPHVIVPLRDMTKVEFVQARPDAKHKFRFELCTVNKNFTFAAESRQEMTEWMMLLGAMITLFEPTPEEQLIGGAMSMPDKQGWIRKQGHNFREGWAKRYMAIKDGQLCYYHSHEEFKQEKPINTIETLLVTVKVGRAGKREKHHQFQLVTRSRNYEFQAESKADMMSWVDAIQQSILWSLNQMQSSTSESRQVETKRISPEEALRRIRKGPGNRHCADCGTPDPDWASINIGTVFCIECAGVHRSLGVHLSKVRSATLDEWTPNLIGITREIGAIKANEFWDPDFARNRPPVSGGKEAREAYIRAKYEHRQYCNFASVPEGTPLESQLLAAVAGPDLDLTVRILTKAAHTEGGIDKELRAPGSGGSILATAHAAGQALQYELLTHNGFQAAPGEDLKPLTVDDDSGKNGGATSGSTAATTTPRDSGSVSAAAASGTASASDAAAASSGSGASVELVSLHEGYLYKRGAINTDWQKRWVRYELGVLSYYKSDVDPEPAGQIALENMFTVESAPAGGPTYRYCFDVDTLAGRKFHFCGQTASDRDSWVQVLRDNLAALPPDGRFDYSTCDHQGYLHKRGEGNHAYKRRFFALKGKILHYFKEPGSAAEQGHINLREVSHIEPGVLVLHKSGPPTPAPSAAPEEFSLVAGARVYVLKAGSAADMEEWVALLSQTKVYGTPLASNSELVPLVVEKCCTFIEQHGLYTEGMYRVPGQQPKILAIKRAFDMDDQAVTLSEQEYSVHDVGGALKLYFRTLPDPLMTEARYNKFIAAAGLQDHNAGMYALQDLLNDLPMEHYETLKRMIVHLAALSEGEETNKMSVRNISLVFGPTLMTVDKKEEGKPLTLSNMGGEYSTVSKLVTYHEWLFNVGAKTEAEISMQQGLKKLEAAKRAHGTKADQTATPFIFEVFYESTRQAHTIPIKPGTTGSEVASAVAIKAQVAPSDDWSVYECLQDGSLERPIGDAEAVLEATGKWKGAGILRLRSFAAKGLLVAAPTTPVKTWLALRVSSGTLATSTRPAKTALKGSSKKWKRFWCTCDPSASPVDGPPALFYYYKDEYQAQELGHVLLTGAAAYTVTNMAESPLPHVLALRLPDAGDDTFAYIAADSEAEMELWRACISSMGSRGAIL